MSKKDNNAQDMPGQQPDTQEEAREQEQTQETVETPEEQPAQEAEAAEAKESPEKLKPKAKAKIDELEKQLAEANDKYMRMLAEYDNYRRRSQKERENIYADVRADTVSKFLPVYDNLSRAVQNETDGETRKGVEAILNQFKALLSGLGVTEIEAVGKKFDPTLHEALLHIEDEKYGEGEIVMELEKGFMLGDRVIRFAKVQVAN
ncbi:MAG: nucleotide exchange factor GrpE [Oscillospiraceae bacterium]|nr:nucleotide exchange factor GrpE [Oscillospiraceae bacterium]